MARKPAPSRRLRQQRASSRRRVRATLRQDLGPQPEESPPNRKAAAGEPQVAMGGGGIASVYVVQPADTPAEISARFGVSLTQLAAANPGVPNIERLFAGQVLQIPFLPPVLPPVAAVTMEYIAQPGDSLKLIADRFAVSLTSLRLANPLLTPLELVPGVVIFVPAVADPPEPRTRALLYVVQPGDTPDALASRFGTTRAALLQANPQLPGLEWLTSGVLAAIPVAGVPATPVFDRIRYVIQPDDTLPRLVRRFEVWEAALAALNPLAAPIPGIIIQMPEPVPALAPPPAPVGFAPCLPHPFGERLVLGDDDAVFVAAAEYKFAYYGKEFAGGLWVNSNGSLSFAAGDTAFAPDTDAFLGGPPRIAPLWIDLVPDAAPGTGGVFAAFVPTASGTQLVVTWDRVPVYGSDAFQTVQVLLNPDGSIQFCYFGVMPLGGEGGPRAMAGLAPGWDRPGATTFVYDGAGNPRRVGNPQEATPSGDLSGRILLFELDPALGSYQLTFT